MFFKFADQSIAARARDESLGPGNLSVGKVMVKSIKLFIVGPNRFIGIGRF